MNKINHLCFAVYVHGTYTQFIPFYIYSILKSYPECYVKVFVRESLSDREKKCIRLISKYLSSNFEIKENYFSKIPLSQSTMRALRFLISYEEFKKFENVYIGDVDFLIVKETPSLLDRHLQHCKKINLPYSNAIRLESKRLSGLHFFKVKDYYNKMNSIIDFYLNNMDELYQLLEKYNNDEKFLYYIVEKGIGFGKLEEYKKFRPHHGFHLGCKIEGYFEHKKGNSKTRYNQLKTQLIKYFNDPLFLDMLEVLPVDKIIELSKEILEGNVSNKLKEIQRNKANI